MAEQRDLGKGARAVDECSQLGEHQGQHEGHGSTDDPGQQARRPGATG